MVDGMNSPQTKASNTKHPARNNQACLPPSARGTFSCSLPCPLLGVPGSRSALVVEVEEEIIVDSLCFSSMIVVLGARCSISAALEVSSEDAEQVRVCAVDAYKFPILETGVGIRCMWGCQIDQMK